MKYKNIIATIILTAIIIIVGITLFRNIFSEGLLTKADNPVHLVEAEYLKTVLIPKFHWINGWYPYVFMGIPIQLYSHQMGIWCISLLSFLLNIPITFSYKIILIISFIIPAITLMLITKKQFGLFASFISALLFLFQREYNHLLIAGMWNSGIGLIFLIIQIYFIDKYKDKITVKRILIISLLQGVIILCHIYVGIASFILSFSAAMLYTYKYKNKNNLLWLLTTPIAIILCAFYTFNFIWTSNWLNTSFGWGLGSTIQEMLYKLIGIFFSLKENTYFLEPLIKRDYWGATYLLLRGIVINLPTIIIDILAIMGLKDYIKNNLNKKINLLDLILVFSVFMLIIGSGFWFLFEFGKKIPIFSGLLSFKFIYYVRISLYIFASFYLHKIIKNKNQMSKRIVGSIICLCIFLIIMFNSLYIPNKINTETFSQTSIKNETEELWKWINNNVEKDTNIIAPVTFREGIASQSTILALTPLYTNISMLSTWVSSYYPMEAHMSSDNLSLFNIPIKKIQVNEIANNMEYYNAKYIITIDKELKNKLNDGRFKLEKIFGKYSIYNLKDYTPSLIMGKNISYKILKRDEQNIVLYLDNNEDREITIKIAYHPYWKGYLDESSIKLNRNDKELIDIKVPKGEHTLKLNYNPINKISLGITIISFIISLYIIIKR